MVETNKLKIVNLITTVLSVILLTECNSFKTSKANGDTNKPSKRIIILGLGGLSGLVTKTQNIPI